ncbi:helix-turn-helix transcriptional regulator [Variovorax sp. RB3P1]|uniref:helix-turn-helix transcriptional regulator n=1 Tax=Variovorax sp. RB3P1 TaxID=3443732 RepID=UPI003F48524E
MNQVTEAPAAVAPLMAPEQAAAMLGVGVDTLAAWRHTGRVKLPYVRVGNRLVRYRKGDIDALIAAGLQPQPATGEA